MTKIYQIFVDKINEAGSQGDWLVLWDEIQDNPELSRKEKDSLAQYWFSVWMDKIGGAKLLCKE